MFFASLALLCVFAVKKEYKRKGRKKDVPCSSVDAMNRNFDLTVFEERLK